MFYLTAIKFIEQSSGQIDFLCSILLVMMTGKVLPNEASSLITYMFVYFFQYYFINGLLQKCFLS